MRRRSFSLLFAIALLVMPALVASSVAVAGAATVSAFAAAPPKVVYVLRTDGANVVDVYSADSPKPRLLRQITAGINGPFDLFVDPAGQLYVANCCLPSTVAIFPRGQSAPSRTITLPTGYYVQTVSVSVSGEIFVAGSNPGANGYGVIELSPTGKTVRVINFLKHDPTGLATDSKGNLYVASLSSSRSEVLVYAPRSTSPFRTLGQGYHTGAVAMNSADQLVVGFPTTSLVATEDPVSGHVISRISAPGAGYHFALGRDGRYLYATGGGPLEYFDYRTGRPLGFLPGYFGGVAVDAPGDL